MSRDQQRMERIGIEPMTSSLQTYSGCRDGRRSAATIGSNGAGFRPVERLRFAWVRSSVFRRLGQEWATIHENSSGSSRSHLEDIGHRTTSCHSSTAEPGTPSFRRVEKRLLAQGGRVSSRWSHPGHSFGSEPSRLPYFGARVRRLSCDRTASSRARAGQGLTHLYPAFRHIRERTDFEVKSSEVV